MATVVNVNEITKRFATLGWDNISVPETLDWIGSNAVPAAALVAYLDAAIASPAGFNDQTIANCAATLAAKITAALKSKGCEAV